MWLPVGVGIAFLYLAGIQFWPGVVIGDLLVNDYSKLPFGSALGQTFGNLLEVLVATLLLQAFARRRSLNGDARGVWAILVAIATGTAISATVIARQISIPLASGIRLSTTTTCGAFSSTNFSASSPDAASPASSKPRAAPTTSRITTRNDA